MLSISFLACQAPSTDKATKMPTDTEQYFTALYFRYVVDTQESLIEFVPAKGRSITDAKPCKFNDGVFYNGGTMEEKQPNHKLPLKYIVKRKDEFPPKIDIQIKDLLNFSMTTPILKQFSAKKEGNQIIINTKTTLTDQDKLIVVLVDSQGKNLTKNYMGAVQLPISIDISSAELASPISVSATYQKKTTHRQNNLTMNVLLEYYTAEMEI